MVETSGMAAKHGSFESKQFLTDKLKDMHFLELL